MKFRGPVVALALVWTTTPADACTIALPYAPLSAIPQGTDRTLLIDIVSLSFGRDGTVAKGRIVRDSHAASAHGAIVSIPYAVPPCPDRLVPEKGKRLAVYIRNGRALGWATPEEAALFDRRFRPAARRAPSLRR